MKIALVGPGIMPIPPSGWGAVESVIWDYRTELLELGYDVLITNTVKLDQAAKQINEFSPDFVHIHYDAHIDLWKKLKCKNIAITTHYCYVTRPDKMADDYKLTFHKIINSPCYVFCLSDEIKDVFYRHGVSQSRLFVLRNGACKNLFQFSPDPLYRERSICVGKIEFRKRQYWLQQCGFNIDFAGNYFDSPFNRKDEHYLGEWDKPTLYSRLTDYTSLVLVSEGEAAPLVTVEGLMAGLGLDRKSVV